MREIRAHTRRTRARAHLSAGHTQGHVPFQKIVQLLTPVLQRLGINCQLHIHTRPPSQGPGAAWHASARARRHTTMSLARCRNSGSGNSGVVDSDRGHTRALSMQIVYRKDAMRHLVRHLLCERALRKVFVGGLLGHRLDVCVPEHPIGMPQFFGLELQVRDHAAAPTEMCH